MICTFIVCGRERKWRYVVVRDGGGGGGGDGERGGDININRM